MTPRFPLALAIPLLAACSTLNDKFNDYTNTTVVEGLVLGVAQPDFDFDLTGTTFDKAASGTVFLADAADVDHIQDAPISGATVSVLSDTNGKVMMSDKGDGSYLVTSDDGFSYAAGESLGLNADIDGTSTTTSVNMPAAADVIVAENHTKGTGLTIDLTDQAYASVLVAVFDAGTGHLTFSNQPEGIKEIYDFTHGGADNLVVDVPASAFPDASVYALGVAGLKNAGEGDYTEANTLLSSFMAGKMKFFPISTE